jgi:hypothetical protein
MTADVTGLPISLYARLAGLLYLLTNAAAIFAFSVSGSVIVRNDPAETAANIAAGPAFRLGIGAELLAVVGTVALSVFLYLILRRVNPGIALLALAWRMIENCVLVAITLPTFIALELIATAPYYANGDPQLLQGLMYALLRVHQYGFQIGFLFLGLGSTAFSLLWLRSGYIPRIAAWWGLFASALMAIIALGIVIWPKLYGIVTVAYMAPMGIFEIGLGLWLLFAGIRVTAEPESGI